jgi:uncharacterized protein YecE (DUF72 family)
MRGRRRGKILVGTSGWSYASWRGPFFPPEVMLKHHLEYYATQFETAELNGVFYRTPSLTAVADWTRRTPRDFIFAWKASKFITHWKRLGETSVNSLALIEERLAILVRKAGPVLFQLPPQFEANPDRLRAFIRLLPPRRQYAFEFRHRSWYADDILRILERKRIALCISDHHDAPAPWLVTAPHVYVRGHGPRGTYEGEYPDRKLRDWASKCRAWSQEGRAVYIYFDNDQKGVAPFDALKLQRRLPPP